jgi:hypothetical protein
MNKWKNKAFHAEWLRFESGISQTLSNEHYLRVNSPKEEQAYVRKLTEGFSWFSSASQSKRPYRTMTTRFLKFPLYYSSNILFI